MKTIRKVAVIGAGTMGAGIAGQVANAGIEVWLLDYPVKVSMSMPSRNEAWSACKILILLA